MLGYQGGTAEQLMLHQVVHTLSESAHRWPGTSRSHMLPLLQCHSGPASTVLGTYNPQSNTPIGNWMA